jgi:hypothetical protein
MVKNLVCGIMVKAHASRRSQVRPLTMKFFGKQAHLGHSVGDTWHHLIGPHVTTLPTICAYGLPHVGLLLIHLCCTYAISPSPVSCTMCHVSPCGDTMSASNACTIMERVTLSVVTCVTLTLTFSWFDQNFDQP